MRKDSIARMISITALIPLICAFIFPLWKHETAIFPWNDESEGYITTLFWIWGASFNSSSSAIEKTLLFTMLSIGIVILIVFLIKSFFNLRKDNKGIKLVSKTWIEIGGILIWFNLIWNLWRLYLTLSFPFGIYYIEVPLFFPLLSGTMLIIAGNMSKPLDDNKESALIMSPNFKSIFGLYIFVLIWYWIYFLILIVIIILPELYFNNTIFYFVLYGPYYFHPVFLIIFILILCNFLNTMKINSVHEQKQLNKLYIMTFCIVGISILLYVLLNWLRPTIRLLFGEGSFD